MTSAPVDADRRPLGEIITTAQDQALEMLRAEVKLLRTLLAEARFEMIDAATFYETHADSVITWTDRWPSKGPFYDRRKGVQEAMGRFKGRAAALRTTCEQLKAKEVGQ